MLLNDLLSVSVDARIQYFDVDRSTLMHQKQVFGIVHNVDADQGITIAVEGDKKNLFKVPPASEAWSMLLDGSYKVRWAVYRTQEDRQDSVHEWWSWEAQLNSVD
ncbi:MAG: hypothetical protein HRU20_14470 [Pseudomonadales bacterium]|nr:hypothetical protein [Pseudomonadales bacterium]